MRLVEGMPPASTNACGGCGSVRFIVCGVCDGSDKCYAEKCDVGGFQSCSVCNGVSCGVLSAGPNLLSDQDRTDEEDAC
ncbi:glutaredoxin domain-containing cysteine-rich protein 1-like [Canna indica]|uniref:Glutaredoxin domain-containing cysteine-rich protein 1-like n=1 Tax=Canna indica TaxID=4628 RepID=A0AAQ3Q360_9LILI|nr:glutaredoxin domain-containing cysteine-rich protein 1-like [Canna indica]